MRRLKAARRAYDVHVKVKHASLLTEIKSDLFTKALFVEHGIPLEKLNTTQLPLEITHFSLHKLADEMSEPGDVLFEGYYSDLKKQSPSDIDELTEQQTTPQDVERQNKNRQHWDIKSELTKAQKAVSSMMHSIQNDFDELISAMGSVNSNPEYQSLFNRFIESNYLDQTGSLSALGYDVDPTTPLDMLDPNNMTEGHIDTILKDHYPSLIEDVEFQARDFYDLYAAMGIAFSNEFERAPNVVVRHVLNTLENFANKIIKISRVESYQEIIQTLSASNYKDSGLGILDDEGEIDARRSLLEALSDPLKEKFGSVTELLEKVGDQALEPKVLAEVLRALHLMPAYAGEAHAIVAEAATKLQAMLPVHPSNAAEVGSQLDHIVDLEHNTDLFLRNYVDLNDAKLPKGATPEQQYLEEKGAYRFGLKEFFDHKSKEWDWEWMKEASPQFYNMYQSLKSPSMAKLVKLFTKFAQQAQPIKGRCPESGEWVYMSQSDMVQNNYKADCPEGKIKTDKLEKQKAISILEYKEKKDKKKKKKKSNLRSFTKTADDLEDTQIIGPTPANTRQLMQNLAQAATKGDLETAHKLFRQLPKEQQPVALKHLRQHFDEATVSMIITGHQPQAQEEKQQVTPEDVEKALEKQKGQGVGGDQAFATDLAERLGGRAIPFKDDKGRVNYRVRRILKGQTLYDITFFIHHSPEINVVQLVNYKVNPQVRQLHTEPDVRRTEEEDPETLARKKRFPDPMQVLSEISREYGYASVQMPSMLELMEEGSVKGFTKQAERFEEPIEVSTDLQFQPEEQKIINLVKGAAMKLDIPTFIVGGAVRDRLLGKEDSDLDFMCERDAEKLVAYMASKHSDDRPVQYDRSKALAITILDTPLDFINADQVVKPLGPEVDEEEEGIESLEGDEEFTSSFDDAYRRDLTINALMYDIVNSELVDPTGRGLKDLQNKELNTIIDPFIKYKIHAMDMLRAIRFAATLDFDFGPDMLEAMRENTHRLQTRDQGGDISNRRIQREMRKSIDNPDHWAKMRELLQEVGLDVVLGPDIDDVQDDFIGGIDYHFDEEETIAMRIKRFVTKKADDLSDRLDQLLEEQGLGEKKKPGLLEKMKQMVQKPKAPIKPEMSGKGRITHIMQKLDAQLAQTDKRQHQETLDKFLGAYPQLSAEDKMYITNNLSNFRPVKKPRSTEVKWRH